MITDQIAEGRPTQPGSQQVRSGVSEARARMTDLERNARAAIRQRPIVAVLAAIGVGYLAARLVSRAMR